ncbi:MAG TPA: hypothetical protein VN030_07580 [Cellvibrio sp.]|nr:hypothetical protein [Cellvibrio sp.]
MKHAKAFTKPLLFALCAFAAIQAPVYAQERQPNFVSDFEGDSQKWALVYGADLTAEQAHSGTNAIKIEGEASIRTKTTITESGTLELWVRTSAPVTSYKIKVLVNASLSNDAGWTQVGMIEASNNDTEYHAKRVSIDDSGKKYVRLDIEAINGVINIDDIAIDKILLSTALQKNQQVVMDQLLNKLREDNTYQMQVDALRALGTSYTSQLEVQRQYIEYANGIYSTTSLVLATSERSKMANPLAYGTFKKVIDDMKKVSSPIQKTRLESLVRPFGDIATASLNVVTAGAFTAFSEPFKSIIATTFEKSSYENADISKDAKKFAEKNGLAVYETAEKFLGEVEKELNTVNMLDKDLLAIQNDVDRFRKDLSKHLKEYLIYGGQDRTQENFNRVMSKDDQIRAAALKDVGEGFAKQAEALQTRSNSNAQLVQFMLKATDNIEALQEYKERFNLITSAMITYYDKFDHSIAADQNPFTNAEDRKSWEMHAVKTREYIQKSKEAFKKAYL